MKLTKTQQNKQKDLYSKMVEAPYKEPPARLDIAADALPAIKDWEVGKTYKLTMNAKMISKSEGGYDGKQPLRATFEIDKAKDMSYDDDEE